MNDLRFSLLFVAAALAGCASTQVDPPADGKHPHRNMQSDVRSRDLRFVELGCNTALDAGLYTFTFAKTGASVSGRYSYTCRWDGAKWLITSHHSSVMPEK